MISDGTEHKESLDRFSNYLKGRLENHPSPVDPDSWDKISGQLRRRKRIRLGWISSGIAAAVLLIILWLSVPFEKGTLPEQMAKEEMPLPRKEEIPVPEVATPVAETPVVKPLVAVQSNKVRKEEPHAEMPPVTEERVEMAEEITEAPEEFEEAITESQPSPKEKAQPATVLRPFEPEPTHYAELPRKKKKNGQWLLAVAMGTGSGDISLQSTSLNDYAHSEVLPNNPGSIIKDPSSPSNEYAGKEQYVDISHAIPLSVGMTVRKEINSSFAIESGLLYTYLSSNLKKNRVSKSDRLQLHYLGIPVNLVGYIVNKPQWNVYLSGGIMFEKGVQSVLTRREYKSNELVSTTERHSISGIQISLNGALGISYRLVEHWSLYAEPKIYYYFDADQPPSTRTEHPFGLGINAGIRYHF